jgi:hypothetical protein
LLPSKAEYPFELHYVEFGRLQYQGLLQLASVVGESAIRLVKRFHR